MKYDIAKARAELEAQSEPLVVLVLGEREFAVKQPELWGDAAYEVAVTGDIVAAARAMLGEEEYAAFHKLGGTAADVMRAVEAAQGANPPESSQSSES